MSFTIAKPFTLSGIGIHSGQPVTITFKPATSGGISFIRTDLNNTLVSARPENLIFSDRSTVLATDNVKISTPEHLLFACFACQIHHLEIEINAEEVPILDGSAKDFIDHFKTVGLSKTTARTCISISKAHCIHHNNSTVIALPSNTLTFTFTIDYPDSFVGTQVYTVTLTDNHYDYLIEKVAPARTYGFYKEVKHLLEKGLAQGGSLENAVVIGDKDYLNPVRFPDELVRHKLLDFIGDLSIISPSLKGHFIGIKSGHSLTAKLIKTIAQHEG